MLFFIVYASESDSEKLEILFDRYRRLLLYKAYGILNDYALAEDAVSEAFLRIYKNLPKIGETDAPQTVAFMVTIVKNTALTLLAKHKKVSVYVEDLSPDDEPAMEETGFTRVITDEMLKTIDTLKEEIRAPFLLKYAYGLPHKKIAAILRISENNVTVRIHRAKKKLAVLFKEAGFTDEA